MNRLEIKSTKYTPEIILDKDENIFEIKGISRPENPVQFYDTVIQWINEYLKTPNAKTVFVFKMKYFNTSSSKMFLNILEVLEEATNKGIDININWHYKTDDTEMLDAGETLFQLVSVPHTMIEEE